MKNVKRRLINYIFNDLSLEDYLQKMLIVGRYSFINDIRERYFEKKIRNKFSCYINPKAKYGKDIRFPHPVGIVIGEGCNIGNNVTIFQNVTLGAARLGEGKEGRYPNIEDDVTIFAGVVVIGNVIIGKGSTIGANSVVTSSVQPNSVIVGIPGRCKEAKYE